MLPAQFKGHGSQKLLPEACGDRTLDLRMQSGVLSHSSAAPKEGGEQECGDTHTHTHTQFPDRRAGHKQAKALSDFQDSQFEAVVPDAHAATYRAHQKSETMPCVL